MAAGNDGRGSLSTESACRRRRLAGRPLAEAALRLSRRAA